jgi:ribosomal protein L40E
MRKIDVDLFVKFLGMFGSDHAGERANAAALATRMLREAGFTWEEYFKEIRAPAQSRQQSQSQSQSQSKSQSSQSQSSQSQYRRSPIADHAEAVDQCLRCGAQFTEWELKFLGDIRNRSVLTVRQEDVLARICRRCNVDWPK